MDISLLAWYLQQRDITQALEDYEIVNDLFTTEKPVGLNLDFEEKKVDVKRIL